MQLTLVILSLALSIHQTENGFIGVEAGKHTSKIRQKRETEVKDWKLLIDIQNILGKTNNKQGKMKAEVGEPCPETLESSFVSEVSCIRMSTIQIPHVC